MMTVWLLWLMNLFSLWLWGCGFLSQISAVAGRRMLMSWMWRRGAHFEPSNHFYIVHIGWALVNAVFLTTALPFLFVWSGWSQPADPELQLVMVLLVCSAAGLSGTFYRNRFLEKKWWAYFCLGTSLLATITVFAGQKRAFSLLAYANNDGHHVAIERPRLIVLGLLIGLVWTLCSITFLKVGAQRILPSVRARRSAIVASCFLTMILLLWWSHFPFPDSVGLSTGWVLSVLIGLCWLLIEGPMRWYRWRKTARMTVESVGEGA